MKCRRSIFVINLIAVIICLLTDSDTVLAFDQIEAAGDILQVIIPSVAYGVTFYLDDEIGRDQFYKSFATSLAITHGLKSVVTERRPNGSAKSFPSGHTSAAFQGAAFIHQRYGLALAMPAYIVAAFVGGSRVESRNHYPHDVLAGAAIGTLSSFYFTTPYHGVTINPAFLNSHTLEVRISKAW